MSVVFVSLSIPILVFILVYKYNRTSSVIIATVQVNLPPQAGIPKALDSKVMTVAERATGRRTVFVRFGGLDWDARAWLELLPGAGKPAA